MVIYAALILLLQGAVVMGLDNYFMTQCECAFSDTPSISFALSSDSPTDLAGPMTLSSADNSGFACPEATEGLGIIRDFSVNDESLFVTLDRELFTPVSGTRRWAVTVVLKFDIPQNLEVTQLFLFDFNGVSNEREISMGLQDISGSDFLVARAEGASSFTAGVLPLNIAGGETVTITYGEGTMSFGGVQDEFICVSVTGDQLCSSVTSTLDAVQTQAADATLTILGGQFSQNVHLVTMGMFRDANSELLSVTNAGNLDVAAITAATIEIADPLPILENNDFVITEDDDAAQFDLNSFLSATNLDITFDFTDLLSGRITNPNFPNPGQFTYQPAPDAFGSDPFDFTYTATDIPYVCVLDSVDASFEITPLEDAPELLQLGPVQGFALASQPFSLVVATTPDNIVDPFTLLAGTVTILSPPTRGDLLDGNCVAPLGTSVALVDGNFNFCYRNLAGDMVNGETDSFEFTVIAPQGTGVLNDGSTVLTINGGNPVFVPVAANARSLQAIEADVTPLPIELTVADFTEQRADVDFTITIPTGPANVVGTLRDTEGALLNFPFTLTKTDTIVFRPTPGFFNANAQGFAVNENNQVVFDQSCNLQEEAINDVCPDTFAYTINFNGGTEDGVFNIIVTAVDNAGLVILRGNQGTIIASLDDAQNGQVDGFAENLEFVADGGGNVFNIRVDVRPVAPVSVRLDVAAASDRTVTLVGTDGQACTLADCTSLQITGVPENVEAFFSNVRFRVPARVDSGLLTANVVPFTDLDFEEEGTIVTLNIEVVEGSESFLENPLYVGIIGGGGGLCVILLILVLIIKFTALKDDSPNEVKLYADDEVRDFKPRGKESASKRRRSFEDEDVEASAPKKTGKGTAVGGDLQDWEKHVDPKTGEPFYHNLKTGETVWELPSI